MRGNLAWWFRWRTHRGEVIFILEGFACAWVQGHLVGVLGLYAIVVHFQSCDHVPRLNTLHQLGEYCTGGMSVEVTLQLLCLNNMQYQRLTVEINFNLYMYHYFVDISLIL